jgi:D-hydroxyproline dehydrogenase subunit gamma
MYTRRNDTIKDGDADTITVYFEGKAITCRATDSVAAVVLSADPGHTRRTPVRNAPRAPYCMMGACFECLMEIDGVENRQACMILARDGMKIQRQDLMASLPDSIEDGAAND